MRGQLVEHTTSNTCVNRTSFEVSVDDILGHLNQSNYINFFIIYSCSLFISNLIVQSPLILSTVIMSSAESNMQLVTKWMTMIALFVLIILGPFGSICNVLIFTSKILRKSSCAFYFLCTALFELPILFFGIGTRLATENFDSALLHRNSLFCKVRSYLITAMGSIAPYFVVLACIDRCFATSTHVRYRSFSQIKVAYGVSIITIIVGMSINIHAFIFYDIQPICIPQPGQYSLLYSIYLIVFTSIVPNGLILFFSLKTIHHIKRAKSRVTTVATVNAPQQRGLQKTEAQLVVVSYLSCVFLKRNSIDIVLDDARSGIFLNDHRYTTSIVVCLLLFDNKHT